MVGSILLFAPLAIVRSRVDGRDRNGRCERFGVGLGIWTTRDLVFEYVFGVAFWKGEPCCSFNTRSQQSNDTSWDGHKPGGLYWR